MWTITPKHNTQSHIFPLTWILKTTIQIKFKIGTSSQLELIISCCYCGLELWLWHLEKAHFPHLSLHKTQNLNNQNLHFVYHGCLSNICFSLSFHAPKLWEAVLVNLFNLRCCQFSEAHSFWLCGVFGLLFLLFDDILSVFVVFNFILELRQGSLWNRNNKRTIIGTFKCDCYFPKANNPVGNQQ